LKHISSTPQKRTEANSFSKSLGKLLWRTKSQMKRYIGDRIFFMKEKTFTSLYLQGSEVFLGANSNISFKKYTKMLSGKTHFGSNISNPQIILVTNMNDAQSSLNGLLLLRNQIRKIATGRSSQKKDDNLMQKSFALHFGKWKRTNDFSLKSVANIEENAHLKIGKFKKTDWRKI